MRHGRREVGVCRRSVKRNLVRVGVTHTEPIQCGVGLVLVPLSGVDRTGLRDESERWFSESRRGAGHASL